LPLPCSLFFYRNLRELLLACVFRNQSSPPPILVGIVWCYCSMSTRKYWQ
jgi:hypothetical protein